MDRDTTDHPVLLQASFDPKVSAYWMLSTIIIMCVTVIGIPIAIVFAIVGNFIIQRYLERLRCTLTDRTLEIKKGWINRVESTIPLEKITDLQLFQGPIMRRFGLHGFRVETAGQSVGPGGSLVNLVGIVDTPSFRKAVLAQRDAIAAGGGSTQRQPRPATTAPTASDPSAHGDTLTDIRDILVRIERTLDERDR